MKNIKIIFTILVVVFSIENLSAQFGQQQGGGFGQSGNNRGQGGGFDNNIVPQSPEKAPEMSEKEKKQNVDKVMENLKKELKLDELQVIGVQSVIYQNVTKQNALFKKEISQDEKIIEMQGLSDTTDRKIIEFLNKDQKTKYKEMTLERKEKLQELVDRVNR